MTNRIRGEGYRTTMVCIDSYENGVPVGRIYHPHLDHAKPFRSTMQFLQEMEQLMDQMEFPKAFTELRTFAHSSACSTGPPGTEQLTGNAATFAVKLLFRQNASWQGSVTWIEGRLEQGFRSVLELLFLMDSALRNEPEASSA